MHRRLCKSGLAKMRKSQFFINRLAACLSVISVLHACSDRPSREKFPGPQGRTTEIQQAQMQQAVLGGFDPTKRALVGAGAAAGAEAKSGSSIGKTLKGVIKLSPTFHPKEGMFFFLAVRRPEGGPPLAVRRESNVHFPYSFTLSAADVMIPGTPFEGRVIIVARLKSDADPLSRMPGDFSGQLTTVVGDQNVQLIIDQVEK